MTKTHAEQQADNMLIESLYARPVQSDDFVACVFCGNDIGERPIGDAGGELACQACGQAELEAQKAGV